MRLKAPAGRLILGPLVGNTDFESTRIWIRVTDNAEDYTLRINGHGTFRFYSTEGSNRELGTAIAKARNLRPNWKYKYVILRRGRVLPYTNGTLRTMPVPGSLTNVLFVSVSCSSMQSEGAWYRLEQYIRTAQPRFLIMMGDQIYTDDIGDPDNIWDTHLGSSGRARRAAFAEKYQKQWSREPIRTILANIPTYMVWDDHEVRDGWGSWAGDSPTLATIYPKGEKIAKKFEEYFKDARHVYYHFQMSHNPTNRPGSVTAEFGGRFAQPYWFQCGRLVVLVLDSRGARDLWRESNPVLGDNQWRFINNFLETLPSEIDALAVVTSVPIVCSSPTGLVQCSFGHRFDDVELFREAREKEMLDLMKEKEGNPVTALINNIFKTNIGTYRIGDLDDVRDQWSHHLSQPEQIKLILSVASSSRINRQLSNQRGVVFLGGDVHVGGILDITVPKLSFSAQCLVSSGISQQVGGDPVIGLIFDEKFEVTDGIIAELQDVANEYNFGVTHIIFTGGTPQITNNVAHRNLASYWGLRGLRIGVPLQ